MEPDRSVNDFECLSGDVPTMMALVNDLSYDDIFVVLLKNKPKAGDVVIGISGSGNSGDVACALVYANEHGEKMVAISGDDGGKIKQIAQYVIHVNVDNIRIVEDMHMMIKHLMMHILSGKTCC